MDKNRIQGAAEQGERAHNREALVIKAKWRRSGGCAVAVVDAPRSQRLLRRARRAAWPPLGLPFLISQVRFADDPGDPVLYLLGFGFQHELRQPFGRGARALRQRDRQMTQELECNCMILVEQFLEGLA